MTKYLDLDQLGSFDADKLFQDIKDFVKEKKVKDHEQVLEDAFEDRKDGSRVS